jgi:phosphoribosylformylglycinamidine cyclo-ligase
MHRTFNCGVGMTVIVGPAKAEAAIQLLSDHGLDCWALGRIEAGDGSVVFSS